MKNSTGFLMCLMSGLLLGLSVPSFPFAPLGFLAWVWMVPVLFELKRTPAFGSFAARSLIAVGVGFTMITIWVVNASLLGLFASVLMGLVVWTVPLLWVYVARRIFNWTTALWTLPFVWTVWEWLYHGTEFSFGAVRLGYTQADLLWFIQFADLTGVEGVTFWLVLLNVALFVFIERQFGAGRADSRQKAGIAVQALIPALLLILPLGYGAFVFLKPQPPEDEITVSAVQQNVSPYADFSPERLPEIFGKQFGLTDRALKNGRPDLILWNEVAVPYILTDETAANTYFAKQLKKWQTPVLTGLIAVKDYAGDEPRPKLLVAQDRKREFFNTAGLFDPARVVENKLTFDLSDLYLKRRLMPFLEHVPFSDRYPGLADLIIPIGSRPRLSYGTTPKVFTFQTQNGRETRVGTMICYENLYPEMSADMVRGSAEFLAAITNEGFFAGSQGQYQLAAFSRFRAIETRRAVVRAASTGMTRAVDKFGRVTAEVPMWSEQTLTARIALSGEETLYVRYGNWFPKFCALILMLVGFAMLQKIFGRRPDDTGKSE